ncbi:hypothetical protein AB0L20_31765, partial [Streptomyces albidoflavus]|uniref:hypothetical protein n=1 Tax=Streptomyces albidoflavus TaxID=1886 RepID=UPI00341CEC18
MLAAESARSVGSCAIETPWGSNSSRYILEYFFKSARSEVLYLDKYSSTCVADLHTKIAASLFVTYIISLFSIVATIPFFRAADLESFKYTKKDYKNMLIFLFLGAVFFHFVVAFYLNTVKIINFDKLSTLRNAPFRDGYTDLSTYFIIINLVFSIGLLANWMGFVLIN